MLLLSMWLSCVTSTKLFVSSYSGLVTTLDLAVDCDGTYTIENIAETNGCSPSPSWLTYDATKSVLYCSDEGLTTVNATLSSFKPLSNGTLLQLDKIETINGGVSSAIYGNHTALAVAH